MAIVKKIISYILALVLSISIISTILLMFVSNSVFNKANVKKELIETDYYYYMYSIIQDSCNNTILQSGFDSKVLNDVVTEKQVQEDIDKLVDYLYDNKEFNISTVEMRQTLERNIQKYIEENGFVVGEETRTGIEDFINTITDTYKNNIMYSQDAIKEISKNIIKIMSIMKTAKIILCISTLVLVVIIFLINKTALGVSLIISGAFFMVVKAYSGVNMAINNVLILNWAFSKSVTYILNKLLQNIFKIGIAMFIFGIIIVVLGEVVKILKLKAKETNRRREKFVRSSKKNVGEFQEISYSKSENIK